MKIAIIGAGWYGCHIASSLIQNGAEITIFEKNNDIFLEASSKNQFRLHQGLHYARSAKTRHQSRDGFFRFIERYPSLSKAVKENYYLVPKYKSLIDFDTYFSIMFSSGMDIEKFPLELINYIDSTKFQGALKSSERVLLNTKAKKYFFDKLSPYIIFNSKIEKIIQFNNQYKIHDSTFDYVVNSTWGDCGHDYKGELYYEPTLLLYYKCKVDFPALTLVDGPLLSLYPTEISDIYTLSSVTHTPLGIYSTKSEGYIRLNSISKDEIKLKINLMENEIINCLVVKIN